LSTTATLLVKWCINHN